MSYATILQHAPYEGAGRIIPVLKDYGIPVDVRHLYKGDEVPKDLDEIRILIVLGGPMGVADVGKPEYPYLQKELDALKVCVQRDLPVLGICLGAQLLAHAGGAKVYPNVKPVPPAPPPKDGDPPVPKPDPVYVPEIGWGPVTFPFPGGTEPIVMGMIDGSPMFHWHHDTFDLPKLPGPPMPAPPPAPPPPTGNALLSASKLCRNQAFRFKNRLFGFQYHFELTREGIAQMVEGDKATAVKVLGADAVAKISADTEKFFPRYERQGTKLLENFVQFLKAY